MEIIRCILNTVKVKNGNFSRDTYLQILTNMQCSVPLISKEVFTMIRLRKYVL